MLELKSLLRFKTNIMARSAIFLMKMAWSYYIIISNYIHKMSNEILKIDNNPRVMFPTVSVFHALQVCVYVSLEVERLVSDLEREL